MYEAIIYKRKYKIKKLHRARESKEQGWLFRRSARPRGRADEQFRGSTQMQVRAKGQFRVGSTWGQSRVKGLLWRSHWQPTAEGTSSKGGGIPLEALQGLAMKMKSLGGQAESRAGGQCQGSRTDCWCQQWRLGRRDRLRKNRSHYLRKDSEAVYVTCEITSFRKHQGNKTQLNLIAKLKRQVTNKMKQEVTNWGITYDSEGYWGGKKWLNTRVTY